MPARFREIFLAVYEHLPRQGPGDRECAAKALALCRDLPEAPEVLDLGCGAGAQTLHLAEFTAGRITAIDNHPPFIERLGRVAAAQGLAHRIRPVIGDMNALDLPPAGFDLIWSEGALYQIGIKKALGICRRLLRPRGHLVFTDAIWRREDPPPEVKAAFDLDYPAMGWPADMVNTIQAGGFQLLDRFPLPDEAWWDDFYTPMEARVNELREEYSGDAEALSLLDAIAREPELHRLYSDYYAYECFVARRLD